MKAEAASQEAEVARLHGTTVQQLYLQDLDAFSQAYEAWEADEAANSGLPACSEHCITDDTEATAISMAICLQLPSLPNDALLSASASNLVHSLIGDSSTTKLKPSNKPHGYLSTSISSSLPL